MAKIKISKIRLSPGMSDSQKIYELEKNLYTLECALERVLADLSGEGMSSYKSKGGKK